MTAAREARPPYLDVHQLARLFSVEDFEPLAAERIGANGYEYIRGFAGSGWTAKQNVEAFKRLVFRPRVLRDVSSISLATTVLGTPVDLPVLFAPTSVHRLAHPEGELATARAAKRVGTIYVMSTGATTTLEEVASIGPKRWFQLYWFTDHGVTRELVERAAASGFGAIVVTVDAATEYWREGEERDPLRLPDGVSQQVLPGHPGLMYEPTLTWSSLEWLRSISPLPILLKGIIRGGDARLAADNGVAGVLVSNHGGREVDGCIPTLEALPAVVEAVDGRIEVLLDGGVRRGTDVLKALALGARAVLIGRAVFWGLGTGGEDGIVRMLELIRGEFASALGLCGCSSVDEITRAIVRTNPDPLVGRV